VGEGAAVEIMKAGADDYLTKENMSRLCPAIDRSLAASLENRVDLNRRMARERYEIELAGGDFPAHLPEKTGQELTRLVQEALTNVRCHAGTNHVRVELGTGGGLAHVEVSDDGYGFDPRKARTGIGHQSMNQRARARRRLGHR
jgi:signal transduction histidine kinase